MRTILLIIFALAPFCAPAQSQGITAKLISHEQGLPDRHVTCVVQDTKGFLWVGTRSGLFRYDGYTFTNYSRPFAARSGSNNCNIYDFVKNENGDIWLSYQKGMAVIPAGTDSFRWMDATFRFEPRQFFFDHSGNCWMTTSTDSIYVLSPAMKIIRKCGYVKKIKDGILRESFYEDKKKRMWVLSRDGSIDVRDSALTLIVHFSPVAPQDRDALRLDFTLSTGQLKQCIVSRTDFSNAHLDMPGVQSGNYSFSPWAVYFKDNRGNVLYAGSDSCRLYFTSPGTCADLTTLLQKATGKFGAPFRVYQTSDNTIWLCTQKGLIKIFYTGAHFYNYLSRDLENNTDAGISVRGITQDDSGNIWIGTYVTKIDGKDYSLFKISAASGKIAPIVPITEDAYALNTYFICPDKNTLWLTKEFHSVFKMDRATLKQQEIKSNDTDKDLYITNLAKINDSTFYCGGYRGVSIMHPDRDKHNFVRPDSKNGIATARICNILPHGGNFWVASYSGIFELDGKGNTILQYNESGAGGLKLPANIVYDLYFDQLGNVWAGTKEGLVKIDTARHSAHVYTDKDGLCDNNVYAVVPDNQGYFWLSTNNGLSRFNPATGSFTNYYTSDNLPQNEFNHIAHFRAADGRLFFGGLNGLTAFYPQDFDTSFSQLQVYLVNASKYDGGKNEITNLTAQVNATGQMTLNYGDKLVSLNFMIPSYKDPAQNRFTYKLDGWDNEWQFQAGTNNVAYSSLPPGTYTLYVKGGEPGGTWSNKMLAIRIIVLQAWFRTWWFYLLCSIAAAGIGYLLYRIRLAGIMREHKLRNKISADLHDELGSVLTQISLQSNMLQSGIYTETEKEQELENISVTSRNAITAMSDIVWSIKADEDRMANLTDRMSDHADLMLQPLAAEIKFTVSGIDETGTLNMQLRQQLFFIYKEAINNILQHSLATLVTIEIINRDGNFVMSITNNNCIAGGRVNKIGGNGLKNMQMRAAQVKGRIDTFTDGHTFCVQLKCKIF